MLNLEGTIASVPTLKCRILLERRKNDSVAGRAGEVPTVQISRSALHFQSFFAALCIRCHSPVPFGVADRLTLNCKVKHQPTCIVIPNELLHSRIKQRLHINENIIMWYAPQAFRSNLAVF